MKSKDICSLLEKAYAGDEWLIAFEVPTATGLDASRRADAVAMNMWPSRGLALHGFEIKVSRSDFLREIKTPEKAETLYEYCDYWWMVVPEGLVKPEEVPEIWGLKYAGEKGLKTVRQAAPKQRDGFNGIPPSILPRSFSAAFSRALNNKWKKQLQSLVDTEVKERVAHIEKTKAQSRERERLCTGNRIRNLERIFNRLKEEQGIDIPAWLNGISEGKAADTLRMAMDINPHGYHCSLDMLAKQLQKTLEHIETVNARYEPVFGENGDIRKP